MGNVRPVNFRFQEAIYGVCSSLRGTESSPEPIVRSTYPRRTSICVLRGDAARLFISKHTSGD